MVRVKNVNLDKTIDILELDSKISNILKENSINYIEELWVLTRKKLKDFGIKDSDIKTIIIKMQLLGLDLNKKVYN